MKSLKDCKRIFIGVVCLLHGIAVADTTKIFVRLNSDPFAAPHYIFSNTENGDAITPELVRGSTYVFNRTDSGHAFNIGSGWRTADSNLTISSTGTDYAVSDVASIETGQKLTVEIPSDFSGSTITYYCYLHSSMVSTISVVDPAPVDPNTVDTDSDGIPDVNDADDDGDKYSDDFEIAKGTISSDSSDYPGSRGYINMTSWSVRGDIVKGIALVRVGRLFSSVGSATVSYKTVDGASGKAGVSYVENAGVLEWEDGEADDKTIEIKLIAESQTPRRDFFVELYDASVGAEILGWKTQIYFDGYFQNKQFDGFSGLIDIDPEQTFAEGADATVWVKRLGGSAGEVRVDYEVSGCGSNLNEASSDPRDGTIVWGDGDSEDKPIRLRFEEDDGTIDRRLDCNGYVYLRNFEPTSAATVRPFVDGGGRGYLVYNNDFTQGIVHDAQPVTGTSEGLPSVELKIVRRGPPTKDSEVMVEDTVVETGYLDDYLFGQNGVQFVPRETEETLSWTVGEASQKSIFVDIKNDPYSERDSLIKLQTSGEDFDRYKHLFIYSIDDDPIFADLDTDGDGLLDRTDPDMDGDGVYDWWDTDIDGDGVVNASDSHTYDPRQSNDTDYDGIGNDLDWKPEDPTEQFDTDSDGVGNNEDADDDGDGVEDTSDAFPLDSNESIDTDSDGIGNNADADDDGDGFSDEQEASDGTDALSKFSCKSGCFSFDVDQSSSLNALTDGLLVMRHLFDFSGDTLVANATDTSATRSVASDISSYLTDAQTQLDIDGSGDVGALTDGLLLIRYLFDFRGESLISNAVDANATRKTAEDIEAYIAARVPES